MKNKKILSIIFIVLILAVFIVPFSFAVYRENALAYGDVISADWNVSLNQTGIDDHLSVVTGSNTATYDLRVTSNSKVDVVYTVVISNLPAGVEVSFDSGAFQSQVNNTVSFTDVGTILYSDVNKTKTHTLTFKALAGATSITDKEVDIDVTFRQVVPSDL